MQRETWAAAVSEKDSTALLSLRTPGNLGRRPCGLIPNFSLFREPRLARVETTTWTTSLLRTSSLLRRACSILKFKNAWNAVIVHGVLYHL